ncbi:MAG: SGNH/GDSL hydrolase family protein [Chthonomonadales bacterium]|nr:SGNH/GDSL hydrolase family protein [Chthonomonadales bacterium]
MRVRVRAAVAALVLATLLAALGSTAMAFELRAGDRVVFYGDSITDQRLYTTFVETYVVTRFPRMRITFTHSGWGGDRVTGGGGGPVDLRLARDVLAYRPTMLTIMLGMNDAAYRAFDQGVFDTYARGLEHIVERAKAALPGVRITLIEPSPFDDVTRRPTWDPGYNAVLRRYGEFVADLARRDGLLLADLNTPVVAMLEKADAADHELAQKLIPDRVHPGPGGQLIMAEALLKAWNAPALVSSVTIDAESRQSASVGARVTGLEVDDRVAWTQLDEALPMPINMQDPAVALAVRSSDFVQALNQQPLRVTGLRASRYTLRIDDEAVGTFDREELDKGINLAVRATPMARQAAAVHALTLRHNDLHFTRWRALQVPNQAAPSAAMRRALEAIDAWEADLVRQQRAAAQPVPHRYVLTPGG